MSQASLVLALPSTAWPCAPPPPPLERIGATAGDSPTCLSSQGQLRIALPSDDDLEMEAHPLMRRINACIPSTPESEELRDLQRSIEILRLRVQILEARTAPECSVSEYEVLCGLQRSVEILMKKRDDICAQLKTRAAAAQQDCSSRQSPDKQCLKPIPRLNTCVGGLLPIPRLNACVGGTLPIRRQNACGGGSCVVE